MTITRDVELKNTKDGNRFCDVERSHNANSVEQITKHLSNILDVILKQKKTNVKKSNISCKSRTYDGMMEHDDIRALLGTTCFRHNNTFIVTFSMR